MLACITTYWNPFYFKSLARNYQLFAACLADLGIPLFTVELAVGHDEFTIKGPQVFNLRSFSVLWHRERLINWLIPRLPPEYDKVCWMGCDLLFPHKEWYWKTEEALDTVDIVQSYSKIIKMIKNQVEISTGLSYYNAGTIEGLSSGRCWGARREFLNAVGLYDKCPIGNSDTIFKDCCLKKESIQFNKSISQYQNLFNIYGPKVEMIEGTIYHLWHGQELNRSYNDRLLLPNSFNFDPEKHLSNLNGPWEIINNPGLSKALYIHFLNRNEDN